MRRVHFTKKRDGIHKNGKLKKLELAEKEGKDGKEVEGEVEGEAREKITTFATIPLLFSIP